MAYAYADLIAPENTGSGVGEYMLLCPVKDIDTIQCPEAPFAAVGDEVKIKVAHELKTGKKFIKVLLAPEKNQYDANTIGDKGFNKLSHEYKFFVAGSYAAVHEAVKNWLNTPLIVLVPESDCEADFHYQLGCDCIYAYATMSFKTGTTVDGVKGYEGTVTYQSKSILMYTLDVADLLVAAS